MMRGWARWQETGLLGTLLLFLGVMLRAAISRNCDTNFKCELYEELSLSLVWNSEMCTNAPHCTNDACRSGRYQT